MADDKDMAAEATAEFQREHGKLGELPATAICGNDITSSCLYVSAFAILAAGKWAPLSLLVVVGVLFLFRRIYAEVVGALPLNGGAYNALLNTTSKARASVAACLTILSYMATAVISAIEGVHYIVSLLPLSLIRGFNSILPDSLVAWLHAAAHRGPAGMHEAAQEIAHVPVEPLTILLTVLLLGLFMGLTIMGITESSRVAIGIFITHLSVLALLVIFAVIQFFVQGTEVLAENFRSPPPADPGRGLLLALFFGFSASMLGISGFESSANYVEEQKSGVFPKTLRNMWIAVSVINPLMALLALCIVPMTIFGDANAHATERLLAIMGERTAGGKVLATIISLNAAMVLSGAVLTSYVGVNGLVRRMTLDRCLPQFLLKTNRRGTTHRIIVAFFILAVSVLLITRGHVLALAGVYTLSFLSVMALFGIGNALLKFRRAHLPRPTRAPGIFVVVGIAAVVLGIYGNAVMKPEYFRIFLSYFLPALGAIAIMLWRIDILRALLYTAREISTPITSRSFGVTAWLRRKIEQITSQQVVFFTRGDNVANLNNAVLYVIKNEHTRRIKVVTVVKDPSEVPPRLETDLRFLNEAYPELQIELVVIEGRFGPDLIAELSEKWSIPTNLMFIGSPRGRLVYSQAELGGVRLII